MSLAGIQPADAAPAVAGGAIRALEERDLAGVAALHAKYLPKAEPAAEEALHRHLARVLLPAVTPNKALASLVYEDGDGRIIGCLGVMPRAMSFQERSVIAAISHSFIVEPGSRSSAAAQELVRRFLAGPQDLSIAESGRISRKLWELDGGCVSLLYGLCWTRPLRPSSYLLSFLGRRGLSATGQRLLRPLCRAVDAAAPLLVKPFRFPEPPVQAAKLLRRTLCASLAQLTSGRALRPRYNEPQVKWMLESLEGKQGQGEFHQIVVRDSQHQIIGWYLCFVKPGAVATVVQIGAGEEGADQVLDHLFHFAYQRGAVAVSGQADPTLFPALARKHCFFHFDGGSYFLLHSRNPELLQAILRGDAFLSRLEGEWWISFLLS